MLDVKPKTTGGFYRGDAAWLASQAARPKENAASLPIEEDRPEQVRPPTRQMSSPPRIELDMPDRPPLRPAQAVNQNQRRVRDLGDDEPDADGRGWGAARVVAWVLLAPFYVVTAVGSIGIDVMFVRGLLGL